VEEVVAIIEKVTAKEMRAVAKELLVGKKLRLSVVGPVKSSDHLEKRSRFRLVPGFYSVSSQL